MKEEIEKLTALAEERGKLQERQRVIDIIKGHAGKLTTSAQLAELKELRLLVEEIFNPK